MKKIIIVAIGVFFFSITGFGQDPSSYITEMQQNPQITKLDSVHLSYSSVTIKEKYSVNIYPVYQEYFQTTTRYKLIHVNSDAGVMDNNKIYIPVEGKQLMKLQVRTISKTGQLKEFNLNNLKEVQNAEGMGRYKVFAVEGLEVGGEMELFYVIKESAKGYGRCVVQKEVPILDYSFQLSFPSHFLINAKVYNTDNKLDKYSGTIKFQMKKIDNK